MPPRARPPEAKGNPTLIESFEAHGIKHVLLRMARAGQILELRV